MRPFLIGTLLLSHVCETTVLSPDANTDALPPPPGVGAALVPEGAGGDDVSASSATVAARHASGGSAAPQQPISVPTADGVQPSKLMLYDHYKSEECQGLIDEKFAWAKYVMAFGVLGIVWLVVGLFVRFQCGGPRFRANMVVFCLIFSIAWLVICLATSVLRRMFEAALRSTICAQA